jgi:hypothetical protein
MDYKKYLEMPNAQIPPEIEKKLISPGGISRTKFADKNEILNNKKLQKEVGYIKLDNGDYLVSMICPMPGMTKEMVDWWFWWHPQENIRYQLWYPGEHFSNGYGKNDTAYFSQKSMPEFQNNTQYPTEKIGNVKMPLVIEFVSPSEFGFDEAIMKKNHVATIVCGHVGAYKGLIKHTEMAHIFFESEDGLMLVSRFWIGKRLKNPIIRKLMLKDPIARGMASHCCVEYRNFAKKVPELYLCNFI